MVNKNIICLEYQNNIPILVAKKNIKIERLNIINKFKEKYTKKELVLQQENILANLNTKILEVKEVLVYLSNNILDINVDNSLFYDKFINDVMVACEDYDQYCTDIAKNLAKEFMLLNINSLTELKSLFISNHKKIMYTYLEESYSFISNPKYREIGFIHIDEPINSFLTIFQFLLKIKEMFVMFFDTLIIGTDISTLDEAIINNFFSQYEFIVFLDSSEYLSRCHITKFINKNGVTSFYNNFPAYISGESSKLLDSIFICNNQQYMFKSPKLFSFMLYLETKHKEIIIKDHLYNFLRENYKDSIFVSSNSIDNTYSYFYDDCIIDFNYVNCMINGLVYTYYMDHFFISDFFKIN